MQNVLEKIQRAAIKFLFPLTAEETYQIIVEEAMKLSRADFGHILLFQDDRLKRVYASDKIFFQIENRKKGFMFSVFKKRQPLILNIEDVAQIHPLLKSINVKSILGIPLSYRNKSVGVLGLLSTTPNFFSKKHINTLKLFSPLASLAIRKAQLYDETKKALEARDVFISMAAHELRTPITTIGGYAQLLQSKFVGSETAEARWIEGMSWETLRLTNLVNELLEVDRIKSGQFQYTFRECNLREVIRRSLSNFRLIHPEHKLFLADKLDNGKAVVTGDFDKLLQLFINLLDNAAKFTPLDKEIAIELNYKSPCFYIKVRDQGKGIPQKQVPVVFEKFFKGFEHNREGMGLGLFLAKNIVKQHRGDIKIYSRENKGTTVEVKLPKVKNV